MAKLLTADQIAALAAESRWSVTGDDGVKRQCKTRPVTLTPHGYAIAAASGLSQKTVVIVDGKEHTNRDKLTGAAAVAVMKRNVYGGAALAAPVPQTDADRAAELAADKADELDLLADCEKLLAEHYAGKVPPAPTKSARKGKSAPVA